MASTAESSLVGCSSYLLYGTRYFVDICMCQCLSSIYNDSPQLWSNSSEGNTMISESVNTGNSLHFYVYFYVYFYFFGGCCKCSVPVSGPWQMPISKNLNQTLKLSTISPIPTVRSTILRHQGDLNHGLSREPRRAVLKSSYFPSFFKFDITLHLYFFPS